MPSSTNRTGRSGPSARRAALLVLAAAGSAAAQPGWPGPQYPSPQGPTSPAPAPYPMYPGWPQYGQQGSPGSSAQIPPSDPQGPAMEGLQNPYGIPTLQEGFQSLDTTFPNYRGFPTFGPTVPGFGIYPGQVDVSRLGPPPPARPRGDEWPTWITSGRSDVPAPAATQALLTHVAERVWYLEAGEDAYVPLAFHDRFRVAASGSAVHVSARGEFLLAFHDTGSVRSFGPAHVGLVRLSEDAAELAIPEFHRMWITARKRPLGIALPDGSRLEASDTELQLLHTDVDARGTIHNYGPGEAVLHTACGEVRLTASRRVDLFLRPPQAFVATPLQLAGAARAERRGRTLVVEGGGGGVAAWSGARFELPSGTVLRLDPLAGDAFPDYRQKQP